MFKLIVLCAFMAIASAAPAPGFIGQPILARYAPAPEAPASTAHATHLAGLAPIAYAAAPAYYASHAYGAPLAYAAPHTYAAPAYYAASPLAYNAGYHVGVSAQPVEQHGYRIAY